MKVTFSVNPSSELEGVGQVTTGNFKSDELQPLCASEFSQIMSDLASLPASLAALGLSS